jgi:hypothetical protein
VSQTDSPAIHLENAAAQVLVSMSALGGHARSSVSDRPQTGRTSRRSRLP